MTNNITLNGKLNDKSSIQLNPKLWQFVSDENNLVATHKDNTAYNHKNYLKNKESGKIKEYAQKANSCLQFKTYGTGNQLLSHYLKKGYVGKQSNTKLFLNRYGYSPQTFLNHIKNQFNSKMTFENYGIYWELDHIKSFRLFKFESFEDCDFKKCYALSNLRPLSVVENRKRSKMQKYSLK